MPDGAGRSVTVSNWGVAQSSRHRGIYDTVLLLNGVVAGLVLCAVGETAASDHRIKIEIAMCYLNIIKRHSFRSCVICNG